VTLAHDFSEFRDHALSANPEELRELVSAVGRAWTLRGAPDKRAQPAEEELRAAVRRAIVAARDLEAGVVLAEGDLTWMRPRDGLAPGREPDLLGRPLKRAVGHGEPILREDVE
jgi:sialic acid synthase SpsE